MLSYPCVSCNPCVLLLAAQHFCRLGNLLNGSRHLMTGRAAFFAEISKATRIRTEVGAASLRQKQRTTQGTEHFD